MEQTANYYDMATVDGLIQADRMVREIRNLVINCDPAWKKLQSVLNYIDQRQNEETIAVFADPEAAS
jgi:hypothetical protein